MVTKLQLAYIAGFVDGEGQLSITRHKNIYKKIWHGTYTYHSRFQIHNNKLHILEYIQHLIGGTIETKKPAKPTHSIAYRLTISRHVQELKILEKIIPFLRIKKEQAKLLHKFILFRLKNKSRKGYSDKEVNIYHKIKDLNKKGPRGTG